MKEPCNNSVQIYWPLVLEFSNSLKIYKNTRNYRRLYIFSPNTYKIKKEGDKRKKSFSGN